MAYGRLILFVGLVIGMSTPQGLHGRQIPAFSNYDYYVTEDGNFGLYKPKGWKVGTQRYPNGKMVFVTDQRDLCYVSMLFLESIDPKHDSVTFAGSTLNNVSKQMPDIKILEARSSQDRTHTVVKYQRSSPKGIFIEGKYSFNIRRPAAVVFGYEAPAQQFTEMLPILLTIIANLTLLDDEAYRTRISQTKGGDPPVPPMREVSAQDNTCRLLVPNGWNLTAGKGAAACSSPDESAGFIFTVVGFVARSRIPYFDSSKMPGLHSEYMRPVDALIAAARHTGSSNRKVLERRPNPSVAVQGPAFLNKQVDAEIALVSYTNRKGMPCVGYYEVVGGPPDNAGQWGILAMGFWAPESQFGRYLASLIGIAESFRINEQWAAKYVQEGMQKVKQMMKDTSSMMYRYSQEMRASNLAGHQNRMKSSDYTSYKFSTYMRGEQEWVTGLEGGKIYKSDHYGISSGGQTIVEGPAFNYYNYHGEKYGHIPVDSSREVYEAVKGIR